MLLTFEWRGIVKRANAEDRVKDIGRASALIHSHMCMHWYMIYECGGVEGGEQTLSRNGIVWLGRERS